VLFYAFFKAKQYSRAPQLIWQPTPPGPPAKSGKPGFSSKSKEAVPKTEVLEQPHITE
jgi:hypothetical protein